MVVNCPECGEHTFATRYKDSYLSFCRECGYYTDVELQGSETVEVDGFLDEDEFKHLKERFPIHT